MRSRPLFLASLAVTALVATPAAADARAATAHATSTRDATVAALAADIRTRLVGSTASHIAYRVNVADSGHVSRNATSRSAPASNEKLLVAVTALDRLGGGFHFVTSVTSAARLDASGVLHGSLVLRGSGDPTLTMTHLRALADILIRAGIRHVTGNVVVDPSRYAGGTAAPGWKASWLGEETGPVSAFAIGKNQWRGGSAFLSDPTPYNARRWRKALIGEGIAVDGHASVRTVAGSARVLASHRSASLATILTRKLPNSDNFTAEMLLREVGFARSAVGTRKTGIAAVLAEARRLRVSLGTVLDGSGLSRKNRESPSAFVRWLAAATRLPSFPALYAALPVSCETGTLKDRLCGPETTGAVHAKTGTLDHVRVLSGFTTTHSGKTVTFSIMLAGVSNLTAAQRHLDSAVRAIVRSDV